MTTNKLEAQQTEQAIQVELWDRSHDESARHDNEWTNQKSDNRPIKKGKTQTNQSSPARVLKDRHNCEYRDLALGAEKIVLAGETEVKCQSPYALPTRTTLNSHYIHYHFIVIVH